VGCREGCTVSPRRMLTFLHWAKKSRTFPIHVDQEPEQRGSCLLISTGAAAGNITIRFLRGYLTPSSPAATHQLMVFLLVVAGACLYNACYLIIFPLVTGTVWASGLNDCERPRKLDEWNVRTRPLLTAHSFSMSHLIISGRRCCASRHTCQTQLGNPNRC
jgi:hypothetical protein